MDLKSLDDIMSWKVGTGLALLAIAIVGPSLLLRKRRSSHKMS